VHWFAAYLLRKHLNWVFLDVSIAFLVGAKNIRHSGWFDFDGNFNVKVSFWSIFRFGEEFDF
jgi:hypothetical protein